MVGLENGHMRKNLTQNGEPQRYGWDLEEEEELSRDNHTSWLGVKHY